MQCPRCQAENKAGQNFCSACGHALPLPCLNCAALNDPGDQFCGSCGQALPAPLDASPGFASPRSYTPPHLAEKILTSRPTLEGERKQVTVLLANLRGSLEFLAERDPEEVRALLDPVLERMMEAVHRYEGTVNQVLGDGIMALFGAPVAHEDHSVRACYAALRMLESVSRYGEQTQRSHGVPVRLRVGLNSGDVIIRAIGRDLHTDYIAVGQTTHLAAAMEQMAQPGSVLLTAETFELAEGYVRAKALGPVRVAGLEAEIQVYQLVGPQPGGSRLRAAVARGLSPFVGREPELDLLRQAFEQAWEGHGQVVALVGDPGVGKSRLFFEVTRSHATQGWLTLEAGAASYGRTTPYLPVVGLLTHYFRIEEGDTARRVREKITGKILTLDDRLKDTIAPLLSLLEALPDDDPLRSSEDPQRQGRTVDALRQLLLQESQRQPLLLVFENLHWIDAGSQALLDGLVESLPTARVLLLVNYRPEYQHVWGSKTYYTQLPVAPLPPKSAQEILDFLLGNDASLEPLKQLLISRTEGNPFFLEESVRELVESQVLIGGPGAYSLQGPAQLVQMPATVRAVLAARIDRLRPAQKSLLQAAAVVGRDVSPSLLQAVAELPEEDLRRGLADLQAAEFLYETSLFPSVEYTFRHALTHEVAYAGLVQERRRALHARVVEAIERLYPERMGEQVERLAQHAVRGELWAKAATYLRQAGAKAAARSAHQEGVACFEQALAALANLPESRETVEQAIDLRFELRPLLLQLGRLQEILSLSQEAERMARSLGDDRRLARVYTYLINYHYLKGEPDRAIEYGERCLVIGKAVNDLPLELLARRYLGHSYHAQGRYELAESTLRQNLDLLDSSRAGERVSQVSISYVASCGWLAFSLAERGEFNLAQGYVDRAQKAAQATRNAYGLAIAWALAGLVAMRRGHLREALPSLERSLEACREKHLAVWQPIPSSILGLTFARLGRVSEGLPFLEDGVNLSDELGIKAYVALWWTHLGEGLLLAGEVERAQMVAQRALDLALAHKERGNLAWALCLLGEIAAHGESPDVEKAEDAYQRAMALAQELRMDPLLARIHFGLGRLHRQASGRQRAEEHLAVATQHFGEMDMRFWVREAWAELKELGRLFIVTRYDRPLYDYLTQMFAGDQEVTLILDRRRGERRQLVQPHEPERRVAARRRTPGVDDELASRGFVIVLDAASPPPTG